MMVVGAYTMNSMYFILVTVMLVLVTLLFIVVQPFKNTSHFTTINALFLLLLALWYSVLAGFSESASRERSMVPFFIVVGVTVNTLPLIYISAIILHWMCSQHNIGAYTVGRLLAWRNGYEKLN